MVIGTDRRCPMEQALALEDWHVIDRGVTLLHEAVFVEQPILVSVRAKPIAIVVMIFIAKTNSNSIVSVGPEFLDQSVVLLADPLVLEKVSHLFAALQKTGTVAPNCVDAVRHFNCIRILHVPGSRHFRPCGSSESRSQA